jgi:hypothetical protein
MAMRKPRPREHWQAEEKADDASRWPYPIQERTVKVQPDGTLRIPATLARMFAFEGDEVSVRLFSDGHIEMDSPGGRHKPIERMTDEEFECMLQSEPEELREALSDIRYGRFTRYETMEEFVAALEEQAR